MVVLVESLNGEQRKDTNKNIEKYLGKFEDFVLIKPLHYKEIPTIH